MAPIRFEHPEWLPFVLVAVLVVTAIGIVWLRRRKAIVRFYGRQGGRIHGQFRVICHVSILSLLCLGLGILLCEPYMVRKIAQDVFEPINIVLAVDISRSMLAKAERGRGEAGPCSPSRLTIVVQEVNGFLEMIAAQKRDKIGLVIFARYAYPAIPVLTMDYQLFRRRFEKEMLLENVLTMPEGTNHWYGVERALTIFDPEAPGKKLLIILTDGEPNVPEDALEKSREEGLAALGNSNEVGVVVVGIGEPGVRRPIPLVWKKNGCPDEDKGYMVQSVGPDKGMVMTTLTDIVALKALAGELGGEYVHSSGQDLAKKMRGIIERKRRKIGIQYTTKTIDLSSPLIVTLLSFLALLVILKTP